MKRNSHKNSSDIEEAGETDTFLESSDIRGDEKNIAILLFLYLLQGIPLGLCYAIPMILQRHNVSYKQQAEFSFVFWPFSLKLFWAPIVDALYLPKFGRRKSWLMPVQYLMGFFMLFLSINIDRWLGDNGHELNIGVLTILFFILNLLAATQDIAVDGWALTMLKRRNVTHASTCNTVGQTAGYFLGYIIFLALESEDFCNAYLRSAPTNKGIVSLAEFLYFWGIVFIIATTLIGIFKHETNEPIPKGENVVESIKKSYALFWRTINLSNMKTMMVVLLTAKIGYAASDAVTGLKMVEGGMPQEKIALMAIPLIPLEMILPLIISKYISGPKPLDLYLKVIPLRLLFGVVSASLVWITPYIVKNHEVPVYYFLIIVVLFMFHQITVCCMYVSAMSFYARISDPAVGGTYMSFLNTLNNLGGTWTSTSALWLVDTLTFRQCSTDENNNCASPDAKELCSKTDNGVCNINLDGYYILSFLCIIIGFVWLKWAKSKIEYLQQKHPSTWKVVKSNR